MKAPCKKICGVNYKCKEPGKCKYWREFVAILRKERNK